MPSLQIRLIPYVINGCAEMKKYRILNLLIICVLIMGTVFTWFLDRYVEKEIKLMDMSSEAAGEETFPEGERAYYEYIKRSLEEADARNQEIREANRYSSDIKLLNITSTELKDWEAKLNVVYDEIIGSLEGQNAEQLAKEQQEWLIQRDINATRAAAGEKGSRGSLEYVKSQTESTRVRTYELLEKYSEIFEKDKPKK